MPTYSETIPLYQQVEEDLKNKITSGEWPLHFKLPDEIRLAQQLDISRGTLRKSIKALVEQGLLTHIRGKGTFVHSDHLEQQLASSLISFAEALEREKRPYRTVLLSSEILTPDPKIRSFLRMEPEEQVALIERIRLVENQPVIYMRNYVNLRLCPGILQRDLEQHKLFDLLEKEYGLPILWGQRYFKAVPALGTPAFNLSKEAGTPLMYLEQTIYTTGDQPIEHSNVWLDSDRFELMALLTR